MSFFDEGDEPTRVSRPARPRRPATGSRSGARPGGTRPPDPHTARVRQAVLIGVVLLFLILFAVVINGCRTNARKRALKDYNRNVYAVITDSNDSVSQPFFRLLSGGSSQAGNLQSNVNQLRIAAEEDVKRAKGFDVPGGMRRAQLDLTQVLNFRAEALGKIANQLPTAVAQNAGSSAAASDAINKIAGQMQAFLASDVIYSQRVIPYIKQTLDDNNIGGQQIATSSFLPSLAWLSPAFTGTKLNARVGGRSPNGTPAPGTHGHGIDSVSIGRVTLQCHPPGGSPLVIGDVPYLASNWYRDTAGIVALWVLLKYRWLVLTCFLLTVGLTTLVTLLAPRFYTASTRLQLASQSPIQARIRARSLTSVSKGKYTSALSGTIRSFRVAPR